MRLFTPESQKVIDGCTEIGQALFPGLPLAISFGEFGADGGKAGFAVD